MRRKNKPQPSPPQPNNSGIISVAPFSLATQYPQLTSQVLDQGNLGSCVANSFCGIMWTTRGILPSRLYMYFNARVATGVCPKSDSGVDLLQAAPTLAGYGLPPETTWAYNTQLFSKMPPYLDTYRNATITPAVNMQPISQTQVAINTALNNNKMVMFGFYVYPSFMSSQVAANGLIPIPAPNERSQGGHCVHIVGYTNLNNTQYYIIRNSWGQAWGNDGNVNPQSPFNFKNNGSNGGFGYMPVAYILDSAKCFEFVATC